MVHPVTVFRLANCGRKKERGGGEGGKGGITSEEIVAMNSRG